jgi:uroporphyrinogen decarboxylase
MAVTGRMTSKERVVRALQGAEVDRPPFSLWHHFRLHEFPGERHAAATLDFHRKFRTDIVKVMSDFPYPKPEGGIGAMKPLENPFPEQLRALDIIREGLRGEAYFVETVFNPYNQARKVFSKPEIARLRQEQPQSLLDVLEAIAKSEVNHVHRALAAGAAGIFLAIDTAVEGVLTQEEYARFSEPFDRMVLDAASGAHFNILHLHGDKVYLDRFWNGWPVAAINHSIHATGVDFAAARRQFSGALMGGIDEMNYRTLSEAEIRRQWEQASRAAGPKYILSPGCSVPDQSTDEELVRLARVVGA